MASDSRIRRLFLQPPGRGGGYGKLPQLLEGRRLWRFLLLLAVGVLQSVAAVVLAMSIKVLFDALGGIGPGGVSGAIGASIVALACGGLLRWWEYVEAERLAQSYVHAVRLVLFRHALRLGSEGMQQTSRSAILLRFTGDLSPLRQWVSRGLSRGLVGLVTIVATVGGLLILDPFVGAVIAGAMLATALAAIALGPGLEVSTRKVRRQRTRMLRRVQDRLTHLAVIEAHGNERQERMGMEADSRRLQKSAIAQSIHSGALRALGEAGASAASLFAVVAGVFLVAAGLATPGGIVAAVLVAGFVAPKVHDVTRAFEHWTAARIALEKQAAFLALQPIGRMKGSSPRSVRLEKAAGRLEISHVFYRDLVSDLSLVVEPKKMVWVSSSASPREAAALLQLAAGILQPTSGEVTLDGVSLAKLHRTDARRHIALASGRLVNLPGSLRSSILYGVDPARSPLLDEILKRHGLERYFSSLPGGLDFPAIDAAAGLTSAHRLVAGLIRARLIEVRIILLDQSDVVLTSVDLDAVRALLSTFDGGVLWVSGDEPQLQPVAQSLH